MLEQKENDSALKYPISIYIITSSKDEQAIITYLKQKKFYEYTNLSVCFQDDLAILDKRGKLILENKTSILKAPNGSGGVFKTILKYGLSKLRYL